MKVEMREGPNSTSTLFSNLSLSISTDLPFTEKNLQSAILLFDTIGVKALFSGRVNKKKKKLTQNFQVFDP